MLGLFCRSIGRSGVDNDDGVARLAPPLSEGLGITDVPASEGFDSLDGISPQFGEAG